jgi:hypothetical protein
MTEGFRTETCIGGRSMEVSLICIALEGRFWVFLSAAKILTPAHPEPHADETLPDGI